MLVEIVLALLVGIGFGTLTGLFPGIHINLVAAGLLALVAGGVFVGFAPLVLVVFVVAMAVTHTFIDFIPAVFLGAPEEDSFLAVLPGHDMLRRGKGFEAVVLTLFGSLAALPIVLIFSFIFVNFLEGFFEFSRGVIPYVLIFASFYLIFREEDVVNALVVFFLAGMLGLLAFNVPVKEPLLPLLSGLFGVSALVVSLKARVAIPKQEVKSIRKIKLDKKSFWKSLFAVSLVAPLSSFLPGMGSGHAAVISSEIVGDVGRDKRGFLFLVGAINTIVMALSFVTIYAIGRSRTGAAVAVSDILGSIGLRELAVIMAVVVVSGLIAFVIGVNLARVFALRVSKIDYRALSFGVLGILFLINILLSNFVGLIVLITGSALGVFAINSNVRRINLMGALLVPTVLFYLL